MRACCESGQGGPARQILIALVAFAFAPGCGLQIIVPTQYKYTELVLSDSPVAYWRLGEISDTVAADSSGNGKNGVHGVSISLGQPGAISGDTNASILQSNTADTGMIVSSGVNGLVRDVTIGIWVKATSWALAAYKPFFILGNVSAGTDFAIFMSAGPPPNESYCGVSNSGGGSVDASYRTLPSDNAWHYTACSWDGSTIRYYVDGAEVSTVALPGTAIRNPSVTVRIGGGWNAAGYGWSGSLFDEAVIYSRVLSASRIREHYQCGSTGRCPIKPW